VNWRRAWIALAALVAAYVAVQGGEYSTTDLLRQSSRQRTLRASVDSLRHEVDSLNALKRRLATDPALQERIARESHGMVRGDKELVYRFTEPRSAPH
jgi:cell division protein FtsB